MEGQVTWQDVAPAADEAFSVEPEACRWVGEAWIVLSQARLDRYGAMSDRA